MEAIEVAIKQYRASACIECGKCTANCPISKYNGSYSPRLLISKVIGGDSEGLLKDKNLYECLTCMRCQARCPSDVDYVGFTAQAESDTAFRRARSGDLFQRSSPKTRAIFYV